MEEIDYTALADWRYLLRQFMRFSEEAAHEAGLTPQQHQVMLAIKGSPDGAMSLAALAERLQVRHHSAVGLIDRLETHGLVSRASGNGDRRRVFVRLTPAGEDRLRVLSAAHRDELQRLAPVLRAALDRLSE